jgi:hypothetical protein
MRKLANASGGLACFVSDADSLDFAALKRELAH